MLSKPQSCGRERVAAPAHGACLTRAVLLSAPPVRARAQLETGLQWRNYEVKLRLLLHLEELQMEHDIRHYDLESVPMTWDPADQNPRLLTLEVGVRLWCGEGGLMSASS